MKKSVKYVCTAVCLMTALILLSGCGLFNYLISEKKELTIETVSLDKTEALCVADGLTVERTVINREDIPENYEGNVPLSYMIVTSDDQSDDGQSDEDQTEGDQISDEEIDNVNDLKNYIDKIKLIIIIECESKETAPSALKDLTKYLAAEKSSEEGSEMPDVPYYINEFEALLELFFNVQVVDNYYCIYTTSAYELISD